MSWSYTKLQGGVLLPPSTQVEWLDEHHFYDEKVFLITTLPYCRGEIIGTALTETRAKQKCFTRNKKTRKYFYTEVKKDLSVPGDILEEMKKELREQRFGEAIATPIVNSISSPLTLSELKEKVSI